VPGDFGDATGVGEQMAGVGEQMAKGDLCIGAAVRQPKAGQVAPHRRVGLHAVRLYQLHDSERGEGLAHGPQDERRLRGNGAAGRVRLPRPENMDNARAMTIPRAAPGMWAEPICDDRRWSMRV
jgi:hypothetical protein